MAAAPEYMHVGGISFTDAIARVLVDGRGAAMTLLVGDVGGFVEVGGRASPGTGDGASGTDQEFDDLDVPRMRYAQCVLAARGPRVRRLFRRSPLSLSLSL